jgi:hypothetical protein
VDARTRTARMVGVRRAPSEDAFLIQVGRLWLVPPWHVERARAWLRTLPARPAGRRPEDLVLRLGPDLLEVACGVAHLLLAGQARVPAPRWPPDDG